MTKRLVYVFIIAFLLNAVWENLHSALYAHYKGGEITEFILLRATFFDAVFIAAASYIFLKIPQLNNRVWAMPILLVAFAIGLELWALETSRWAYLDSMPIVPLVSTGLTPTIQLGILGYLSFITARQISHKSRA